MFCLSRVVFCIEHKTFTYDIHGVTLYVTRYIVLCIYCTRTVHGKSCSVCYLGGKTVSGTSQHRAIGDTKQTTKCTQGIHCMHAIFKRDNECVCMSFVRYHVVGFDLEMSGMLRAMREY